MQPILSSKTITDIYKKIGRTGKRIADLCEDIDEALCEYAMGSRKNDNEEARGAEQRYLRRLLVLTRILNRMNKLGEELDEEIHKAS